MTAHDRAPADPPEIAALEPVRRLGRRWPAVLAVAVTVAMVAGLAGELLDDGLAGLGRAVPSSPGFYLFFLVSYFALPVSDFWIFRRLWGLPPSGFAALNIKRIANDVLIGVTGDAYFYAWARERLRMVAAPFGAVKDVTLISGVVGNAIAIVLGAIALPLGYELMPPHLARAMAWSLSIPITLSLLLLVFSRRVFSLPLRTLFFIFRVDCLRVAIASLAIALAWKSAMPSVATGMWLFLVAGRQLVLRLPFLPNKDLLFANFAILVIGQDKELSDLMAFSAASTLLLHLSLTVAFGIGYAAGKVKEWSARQ